MMYEDSRTLSEQAASQTATTRWRLRVASMTDVGRARRSNEDAFVTAHVGQESAPSSAGQSRALLDIVGHQALLAVSDGMGGAPAGEVASAMTLFSLCQTLPRSRGSWPRRLESSVRRANRDVWNAGQAPSRKGMGATLTAALVSRCDAYVVGVGDSRAYRWRGGELTQLTHDQTYAQALVDSGKLEPERAQASAFKHVLSAAIGGKADLDVSVSAHRLVIGDVLLLCSDGLYGDVTDAEIARVLDASRGPDDACTSLIRHANGNGGHDNVTVVVAAIEAVPTSA